MGRQRLSKATPIIRRNEFPLDRQPAGLDCRAPGSRRRGDLRYCILRCGHLAGCHRAGIAADVRGGRVDRAGTVVRALCTGMRGLGRVRGRRDQLLGRAPLGPATAWPLAVPQISATTGSRRNHVPPQRDEEPVHCPLRRRGAAFRTGDCRHDAHATAPLCVHQPVGIGQLGAAVPGARLDARPGLRCRRRSSRTSGPGAWLVADGVGTGVGRGAVHLSLVRRACGRTAGAGTGLVARTSGTWPLFDGGIRSTTARIGVTGVAGRDAAGLRLGVVRLPRPGGRPR